MNLSAWGQLDPERRKIVAAIIISILLHLLVILLVAIALSFQLTPPPPPKEEDKALELTLVDEPAPKPKQEPEYIATNENQRAEKPPETPDFQSDKDTHAASMQAPSGQAPLPTQEGEEHAGVEFENQNYTPGKEPRPASPAGAPPQPARSEAQPVPTPAATPEATPEPATTPRTTSPLALLEPPKAKEVPKITPPPLPPTEAQKPAKATTQAQPSTPSAPGYQPQTRITRIRGDISNRGRSSVAANATPLGRYKKQLSDAIGSRWYYYVNEQMGLLSVGTVDVRFVVHENGHVTNFQIVRNTSNESFASCTASSIMEAEIPPIPKELLPMLEGGRIEIEFSFTILSN